MISAASVEHRLAGPIGEATEQIEVPPPLPGIDRIQTGRGDIGAYGRSSGSSSGSEVDQDQIMGEIFEASRQLQGGEQSPRHDGHIIAGNAHGLGTDLDMDRLRFEFQTKQTSK